MDRDVENPMTIDSLWDDIDDIERDEAEAEERYFAMIEAAYNQEVDRRLWKKALFENWSQAEDGYIF